MALTRIGTTFEKLRAEQRAALVAYLTAGVPRTVELALALERGGASVLELGVPFSDPIADGPVIQRASERALQLGTTLRDVLRYASGIRSHSDIPIVLFSYLNPLLRYGFEKLAADAVQAGIDGVLLTDLSVEEAEEPVEKLRAAGLDTIFLAAPTSTRDRLRLVANYSSGFVYVVSRTGITGEQDNIAGGAASVVEMLRAYTSLPIAVGFGVSKPEHSRAIAGFADGVIAGSAFMRLIEEHAEAPDLPARLEQFTRTLAP